ncbi:MAG: hypothetical protein AB9903_03600 [Vulcanimicrobiota bacterium]
MQKITQCEAIIEAFKNLGGVRDIEEITEWVNEKYGECWKDFGTSMADMVAQSHGGNSSSTLREELRILERVNLGKYRIITKTKD